MTLHQHALKWQQYRNEKPFDIVCRPTSKMGGYKWCESSSLEIILNQKFSKLDSQHFWEQMNAVLESAIRRIEDDLIKKRVEKTGFSLDSLFFDTTNFLTYVNSTNVRCGMPQRGKNKQKRFDLRRIGMALLVSREDQIPLFHKTYKGNKNDFVIFKENFRKIDSCKNFYYIAGLVSSYFKDIIQTSTKCAISSRISLLASNTTEVSQLSLKNSHAISKPLFISRAQLFGLRWENEIAALRQNPDTP